MACEICGRNSCCRAFHSLKEQEEYDKIAEPVIERIKGGLAYDFRRLDRTDIDGEDYVKYSDVKDLIEGI